MDSRVAKPDDSLLEAHCDTISLLPAGCDIDSLRSPSVFPHRKSILEKQLADLKQKSNGKKESFDMESAVLFRCAKDFGRHALSVLQTVNKEDSKCDPYEGRNREQALKDETELFVDYIFSALLQA